MATALLFERNASTTRRKMLELLTSLKPLEKELQILWLGSFLESDVSVSVLTKDLIWGSSHHSSWLLYIPPEWHVDVTLDHAIKKEHDLQWIIVESSSVLITTPSAPYQQSSLPIDWWYPFLAWNGSPLAENWLKKLKQRVKKTSTKILDLDKHHENRVISSFKKEFPSNPIKIIQLYEAFLNSLSTISNDQQQYIRAFYDFLEMTSQKNPLFGHLLVKSHGFNHFLNDKKGNDVLICVSNNRYRKTELVEIRK